MSAFQRWADKPNSWPTGERVIQRPKGFLGWLFGHEWRGVVGEYVYDSGSTYVPIHWQNGTTTRHHISEIPGALD